MCMKPCRVSCYVQFPLVGGNCYYLRTERLSEPFRVREGVRCCAREENPSECLILSHFLRKMQDGDAQIPQSISTFSGQFQQSKYTPKGVYFIFVLNFDDRNPLRPRLGFQKTQSSLAVALFIDWDLQVKIMRSTLFLWLLQVVDRKV